MKKMKFCQPTVLSLFRMYGCAGLALLYIGGKGKSLFHFQQGEGKFMFNCYMYEYLYLKCSFILFSYRARSCQLFNTFTFQPLFLIYLINFSCQFLKRKSGAIVMTLAFDVSVG
jgi:hypothetical protein